MSEDMGEELVRVLDLRITTIIRIPHDELAAVIRRAASRAHRSQETSCAVGSSEWPL